MTHFLKYASRAYFFIFKNMAKSKNQKEELVKSYQQKLKKAKAVYMLKPKGVNPNEATALKKELYTLDSSYNTIKNNLFKIALQQEGLPEMESLESGAHAVLFSGDQVSETAKVITNFIKNAEDKMEIIGGILEGNKISAEQIKSLAELPSKDQLLGQLLSVFNGPIRGFVTVAQGNIREFVYLLNAIKEAKATN